MKVLESTFMPNKKGIQSAVY